MATQAELSPLDRMRLTGRPEVSILYFLYIVRAAYNVQNKDEWEVQSVGDQPLCFFAILYNTGGAKELGRVIGEMVNP
jgi:hypothetical protein